MALSSSLILNIESSCDDTPTAVLRGRLLCSNVVTSQEVHSRYGGTVPELASQTHLQNIVPIIQQAVTHAGVTSADLDAIAYACGLGSLGSLTIEINFTKGLSLTPHIPLVEANHSQIHILVHFVAKPEKPHTPPPFSYLYLLVSSDNSWIARVSAPDDIRILGQTVDDAADRALDRCVRVMGLGCPGGPIVSKLASGGGTERFHFSEPQISGLGYNSSGLKTSFFYTLRGELAKDANFVAKNKADLYAPLQRMVIDILMNKLLCASEETDIKHIAVANSISANAGLRDAYHVYIERYG